MVQHCHGQARPSEVSGRGSRTYIRLDSAAPVFDETFYDSSKKQLPKSRRLKSLSQRELELTGERRSSLRDALDNRCRIDLSMTSRAPTE